MIKLDQAIAKLENLRDSLETFKASMIRAQSVADTSDQRLASRVQIESTKITIDELNSVLADLKEDK